ncbi:hypothetical protein [Mycobacteroides saopaulense]|uniref:hypothetical protein n=1 Tax=Mycobacteroides saopaulense TaxID=1578165 RepID=UPI001042593A|nr:hypothetical protein [Mycobacteroides saopaulense]
MFVALIVAAIFVRNHQTDKVELQEPIDVRGDRGERLAGRNIAATITGIVFTDKVIGERAGNHPEIYAPHEGWVFAAFRVNAQSTVSDDKTNTDLIIGENEYLHMSMAVPALQLVPGIPNEGYAGTFEIPTASMKSHAIFRVTGGGDPSRDSRLVFDVDLATAQHIPSITVKKPI